MLTVHLHREVDPLGVLNQDFKSLTMLYITESNDWRPFGCDIMAPVFMQACSHIQDSRVIYGDHRGGGDVHHVVQEIIYLFLQLNE